MKKLAMLVAIIATVLAVQISVFADCRMPANIVVNDPAVVPFENIGIN